MPSAKSVSQATARILGWRFMPRSPLITAFVMLLTCRKYYRGKRASSTAPRGRRRVFFLPKTLFTEDLVNIFLPDDPDLDLWYVSREVLAQLAEAYLPKHLSEYDYRSENEEIARRKEALRRHWRAAIRIFARVANPAAFLTCAYYYRDQREFAAACVANGIPFVALHKECVTTAVARVARQEVYGQFSGQFTGSSITTYNEDEKGTIVAAGSAPADIIDVIGCPRMDPVFRERVATTDPARVFDVVFFSFSRSTYLPYYKKVPRWPARVDGVEIRPWDWSQLYARYHQLAIEFARSHPRLRVALKVKTGFNINDILPAEGSGRASLPENLTLISSGEGGTLASAARVVCGFNSTVLLEAIAARTPVVVPAFGEAVLGSTAERLGTLQLGEAVIHARDEEELTRHLEMLAEGTPDRDRALNPAEQQALAKYVGFFDGRSGERARECVIRAVRNPPQARD
jgi:hypothetical protein